MNVGGTGIDQPSSVVVSMRYVFFFQAEDGIRDLTVTGVQTCALPICTAPSGTPPGRCESAKWTSCWQERCKRWRTSLAYDGERVDGRVLDQLETVLRHVADELASWRARALKAEAELKESGIRGGGGGAGGGGGTEADARHGR